MKRMILAMAMLIAVVSPAISAEKSEKYSPEQRFAKLRKASEALLERHQALREKNTTLEAEIARFAAEQADFDQLKQRITALEMENKQLKVTAAANSEKLIELADSKKQLKRLTQQASASADAREEHGANQVALRTLQKQHHELERVHRELSDKYARMDAAHEAMKEELVAANVRSKQLRDAERALRETQTRTEKLVEEQAAMMAEVGSSREAVLAYGKLKEVYAKLLKEHRSLSLAQETARVVAAELTALKANYAALGKEKQALQQALRSQDAVEQELVRLRTDHRELVKSQKGLQLELAARKAEQADLQQWKAREVELVNAGNKLQRANAVLLAENTKLRSKSVSADVQPTWVELQEENRRLQGELEKRKRQLIAQSRAMTQGVAVPQLAQVIAETRPIEPVDEPVFSVRQDDTEAQMSELLRRLKRSQTKKTPVLDSSKVEGNKPLASNR